MSEQQDRGIPLFGGPLDGHKLPPREAAPGSLLVEGDGVPEGQAARYRYVAKRGGYVFKGLETIILRVPR